MKKLSKESQDIVDRYWDHFNRCNKIEKRLGQIDAMFFHRRWKSDPSHPDAQMEFENMLIDVTN